MRKYKFTIIIAGLFLVGLAVLLYPAVSSFVNAQNQSRVIVYYDAALSDMEDEAFTILREAAHEHNRQLREKPNRYLITDEERARYFEMLSITGRGIMGHIEIGAIGVNLPIYHGTNGSVLQLGAGHIEWSSLPVGGSGTHAALTAHTGLPASRLFSDLDSLVYGDTFVLHVLGEELTYKVDQILVVEPTDTEALAIIDDMDYCTLITCTPYGINSHRLLVRGVRVPNTDIAPDVVITERKCCCILAWPLLVLLLASMAVNVLLVTKLRSKSKSEKAT